MHDKKGSLSQNVLATLVYYDVLDYPLTAFEVWKYLMNANYFQAEEKKNKQVSLREIIEQLDGENLKKLIEKENGFYFLKGREFLVRERIGKGKNSIAKFKKLKSVTKLLRFVPFVRMVGITGTLAMKKSEAKSDLDVLIVLKNEHIWTGRFLVTFVLHVFGVRRYGKKIANRVCLNHYVSDENLEIFTKDLFSANEYFFLQPLFGGKTYQSFQLRNKWIRKMKPNYAQANVFPVRMIEDTFFSEKIRKVGELLLGNQKLEGWLEKMQKKRIIKNPKTYQEGSLIHFSDEALIFLPDPHGPKVFEKFKEKMGKIHNLL